MSAEHSTPPQNSEIFARTPRTFEELLHADRRTADVLLGATTVSSALQESGIPHCFIGGVGVLAATGPHRRIKDADLLVSDDAYYDARYVLDTLPGTFLPIPGAEYILQAPTQNLGYVSPEGVRLKIFHYDARRKLFGTEKHRMEFPTEIDPDWNAISTLYGFQIRYPGVDFMRFTKLQQLQRKQVVNEAYLHDAKLLGLMH